MPAEAVPGVCVAILVVTGFSYFLMRDVAKDPGVSLSNFKSLESTVNCTSAITKLTNRVTVTQMKHNLVIDDSPPLKEAVSKDQ